MVFLEGSQGFWDSPGFWRGSGLHGWVHKGRLSTWFHLNTTSTHAKMEATPGHTKLAFGMEPLLIFHLIILLLSNAEEAKATSHFLVLI